MKKIYPSKMLRPVIFLSRSITAFAKKHAAEAKVSDESGKQLRSLKHILNCVAVGITTERIANFLLTAKPADILVPSLQKMERPGYASHLSFNSLIWSFDPKLN